MLPFIPTVSIFPPHLRRLVHPRVVDEHTPIPPLVRHPPQHILQVLVVAKHKDIRSVQLQAGKGRRIIQCIAMDLAGQPGASLA